MLQALLQEVGYGYGNIELLEIPDLYLQIDQQQAQDPAFQLGNMFGDAIMLVQGVSEIIGGAALTGISETTGFTFTPVTAGASLALAQAPAAAGLELA